MNLNNTGFLIVTIVQIPSFFCAIRLFSRYTQRTRPLRRLQNHVLMCLLIVATWTIIMELPHTQKYLYSGSATIYTSWFCSFWNISFFSTTTLNRMLMAFMSVERHCLVFRPQIYRTRRSRIYFHYIPLITMISTILIYQFVTNIFVSCPQFHLDYSQFMCGYTCAIVLDSLGTINAWVFVFVPTMMTIVGCVLLPIRFIIQKRQLQRLQWHRARKMIIQTSAIASIYTICWLPYTTILQLTINDHFSFYNPNVNLFLTIVPYMTSLVTPFIVFHTIRSQMNLGFIEQMKRHFCPQRRGTIRPVNIFVAQQIDHRTSNDHYPPKQQVPLKPM